MLLKTKKEQAKKTQNKEKQPNDKNSGGDKIKELHQSITSERKPDGKESNSQSQPQREESQKEEVKMPKLLEILLSGNYISKETAEKAIEDNKDQSQDLQNYLIGSGLASRDIIGQAIAEFYSAKYYDLNSKPVSKAQVEVLPEEFAKKYGLVFLEEDKTSITLTTCEPAKLVEARNRLREIVPEKKIVVYCSLRDDVKKSFKYYEKSLSEKFEEFLQDKTKGAPKVIEEILRDAISQRASDIHFEPNEGKIDLRFRVDGVLHKVGELNKKVYENVLNRIRVESHLRIDLHNTTQDGSFRYEIDNRRIDMRISIVPIVEGEKLVIRVLTEYMERYGIQQLGIGKETLGVLESAYKQPFGMIVVTGPTGSGKTTTLYAILQELNKEEVNITTIEDPVEYKIPGVNQIQVNNARDITFAKGLRSIVRQDPDVILVGEIRDKETAEIAVNAALTGHLVLTTFHATDAATAIPRLLDMGVEPFLLSSTLNLVLSQRLARRIIDEQKISHEYSMKELQDLVPNAKRFFKSKATLYKPKDEINGYKGRVGIFEYVSITPEMRELIMENPSSAEVAELAGKQEALDFFTDGVEKVQNGITSIEELLRIAPVSKTSS